MLLGQRVVQSRVGSIALAPRRLMARDRSARLAPCLQGLMYVHLRRADDRMPEVPVTVLVALAVGLLIGALLGTLGGGGSILAVPALVYLLGQTAQEATTTSLVVIGLTAAVAASGHARAGNTRWGTGAALATAGVPASTLGTALNQRVDGDVVLLAFSALMLLAAAGMLARAPHPADAKGQGAPGSRAPTDGQPAVAARRRRRGLRVLLAGLVISALTGFFGVGGGFIIVPVLVVALRFSLPHAVGTSLVAIALNSVVALAARGAAGVDLDVAVVLPFTAAAICASLLGTRLADRVPGGALTRAFGGLLVLVAAYVGVQAVLGLA